MNTSTPILLSTLLPHADPSQVAGLSRFFKTGPGQYGEGDRFLGIKVPVIRAVVKQCWERTTLEDLETTIRSPYHEVRMASLLTLVQLFRHSKKDPSFQQQCVAFYLSHTDFINNWDLVDLSCYEILGAWLYSRDRALLYDLADNGRTLWEQRMGIVSTIYFIRQGDLDDTYAIADRLLSKEEPLHDLLQKAVGWLLREAGKRDMDRLSAYLSVRYRTMPRTLLRYAIEKYPEPIRKQYLNSLI